MDVRMSNYQPVSSQRFGAVGSSPAAVSATAANNPISAISAVGGQSNAPTSQRTLAEVLATNPGKGKLIDIRA